MGEEEGVGVGLKDEMYGDAVALHCEACAPLSSQMLKRTKSGGPYTCLHACMTKS